MSPPGYPDSPLGGKAVNEAGDSLVVVGYGEEEGVVSLGRSDFAEWLQVFDGDHYDELIKRINAIDPYFTTLADLRREIATVFLHCSLEEQAP